MEIFVYLAELFAAIVAIYLWLRLFNDIHAIRKLLEKDEARKFTPTTTKVTTVYPDGSTK